MRPRLFDNATILPMFTALYVIEVVGRPERSKIHANTVENPGAVNSSFKALTVCSQINRMSGLGRLVNSIFVEVFQEISEQAYISQTRE